MGFGMINIAELLADPEQETTLSLKSKGLVAKSEGGQVQQTAQPTEQKKGGIGGLLGSVGSFVGTPAGKSILLDIAEGLSKGRGIGGALTRSAKSDLESQQFNALIAKMERGEEITGTDVVGLSPESQQQALSVVQSKGAESRAVSADVRARELLDIRQDENIRAGERLDLAKDEPAAIQSRFDEGIKAQQERLIQRLGSEEARAQLSADTRIEVARISAQAMRERIAERVKAGKTISPSTIKQLGDFLLPLGVFKDIVDKSGFGINDLNPFGKSRGGGNEEEVLLGLGNTGITEEAFKDMVGRDTLTQVEIDEIRIINEFKLQTDLFKQQTERQPLLPSGGGQLSNTGNVSQIPPSVLTEIDNYLSTTIFPGTGKVIGISDENRIARFKQLGGRL